MPPPLYSLPKARPNRGWVRNNKKEKKFCNKKEKKLKEDKHDKNKSKKRQRVASVDSSLNSDLRSNDVGGFGLGLDALLSAVEAAASALPQSPLEVPPKKSLRTMAGLTRAGAAEDVSKVVAAVPLDIKFESPSYPAFKLPELYSVPATPTDVKGSAFARLHVKKETSEVMSHVETAPDVETSPDPLLTYEFKEPKPADFVVKQEVQDNVLVAQNLMGMFA